MMVRENSDSRPWTMPPQTLPEVFRRGPALEHVYEVEWTHRGAYAQVRLTNGAKRSAFVPMAAVRAIRSGDMSHAQAVPTDGGRPLGTTGREIATWLASRRTTNRLDELETEVLPVPPDPCSDDLRVAPTHLTPSTHQLKWLVLGTSSMLLVMSLALFTTILYLAA